MWFLDLLTQSTIAHAIFIYAFVIAFGVILGKVKIFGVSLGVTFVLFVGIIVGQLYYSFQPDIPAVDPGVLHFIKEFGLILFIFSIGLQVGPGFFSSFKKGGIVLNGLAMLIIGLDLVVALIIYFGVGNINITDLVGVLSGAVTNTPGLGAAQQTLNEVNYPDAANAIKSMSMGYAAAYPLGVVGIILSMILVKVIFKINLSEESKSLEAEKEESQLKPYMITVEVTNRLIHNMPLARLISIIDRNFVISRMKKSGSDEIIIPTSKTIISEGDLLYMVISAQDEDAFVSIIGPKI